MNSKTSRSMADLSFLSITEFLRYVELSAGLTEISTHAVFSFKIPNGGIESLVSSKKKLLEKLRENNRRLSGWAVNSGYDKDSYEMVIIRSVFVTTKVSIEMVSNHVESAELLKDYKAAAAQPSLIGEGPDEEPLF